MVQWCNFGKQGLKEKCSILGIELQTFLIRLVIKNVFSESLQSTSETGTQMRYTVGFFTM